jgi:2-polyprenyl-6-methoxyphenol hydroxylase-like FAD-dependent oxidoreductase
MKLEVCVLGDGIVGRTLALALADKGLRVGLVQATVDASRLGHEDVRAYSLNYASKAVLDSVRGWPAEAATPVQAIAVYDDTQASVQFDAQRAGLSAMSWIVDAKAIEAQLGQALRFAPKIALLESAAEAELTVICEGKGRVHVTQRGASAHGLTKHYQQSAVSARMRTERPHGNVARQWFYKGDIVGLLPQEDGMMSLIWSTHPAHAAQLQALEAEAFALALSQVGSHLQDGNTSIAQVMGPLHLNSERQSWPLRLSQLDHWTGPGWAVAGDAAHTVHPLTGQGLNLGLGDVQALTQVLAGRDYWRSVGDPRLLRRYERSRKAAFAQMGGATDALQNLFTHSHPTVVQLRKWGLTSFDGLDSLKTWVMHRAMGT